MSCERRAIRFGSPAFEPVSLAEVKKHLEIADADHSHDQHLSALIQTARELVEHDTQAILATGTFTMTLDDFPDEDEIELPIKPVSSVTSITYIDTGGTTRTMSSSDYVLDSNEPTPEIRLAYLAMWPVTRGEPNAVTITFVAGYSSAATVERKFKQMMLLDIARNFQDREGWESPKDNSAYERLATRFERSSYP